MSFISDILEKTGTDNIVDAGLVIGVSKKVIHSIDKNEKIPKKITIEKIKTATGLNVLDYFPPGTKPFCHQQADFFIINTKTLEKAIRIAGSQFKLSAMSGVSQAGISGAKIGTRKITYNNICKIAQAIGMNPDDLINDPSYKKNNVVKIAKEERKPLYDDRRFPINVSYRYLTM